MPYIPSMSNYAHNGVNILWEKTNGSFSVKKGELLEVKETLVILPTTELSKKRSMPLER